MKRQLNGSLRGALVVAAALLLAAVFLAFTSAHATPVLAQTTTPVVPVPLDGRQLFAENCAPCHGDAGRGDGPSASGLSVAPAALADRELSSAKSPVAWFEVTKNGNMQRMMPPWKNRLDDQQIWNAVAYAWSLSTSAAEVDQGKAVYDASCASCHGPDGKGNGAGPDLTDFAVTSGASQAAWAASVSAGKGDMPGFDGKVSADDQRAALVYVRSLSMGGPLFRAPLAKGSGVISGTVTNGTTGQPAGGIDIQLGIFDQSAIIEERKATTDEAGLYRFTDLPVDPGLVFAARAQYPAGIPYSTEFLGFEGDNPALDLSMEVYETTDDPAGVRADRVHYIVEFEGGRAIVAELLVFSLDGDRTYLGDSTGVIKVSLPAGAQEVTIDGDEGDGRYSIVAGGFIDRLPLTPGQATRQLLYRYALPYTGSALDLTHKLTYPVANLNALISDVGQQVSSAQLENQGTRDTGQGSYLSLLGQNLAANGEISIRMTGLPAAGVSAGAAATAAPSGGNQALVFILAGAALLIAAALVALPMLRRRGLVAAAPTSGLDQEELLEALASLDNAYEAGELGETAYRDRRLRLKAQLRDLLQKEARG